MSNGNDGGMGVTSSQNVGIGVVENIIRNLEVYNVILQC